jgi:hypothetical protein
VVVEGVDYFPCVVVVVVEDVDDFSRLVVVVVVVEGVDYFPCFVVVGGGGGDGVAHEICEHCD